MIAIFRLCFDPSHFPRPVGFSRTEKKRPAVCNGGQLGRNELCSVFPDTYFVSLDLYFNVYHLYLDICIACILSLYCICQLILCVQERNEPPQWFCCSRLFAPQMIFDHMFTHFLFHTGINSLQTALVIHIEI